MSMNTVCHAVPGVVVVVAAASWSRIARSFLRLEIVVNMHALRAAAVASSG